MESVWWEGVKMPEFKSLDEELEVNTVVVGGGMAGLLVAYKLKEKGVDAAVLEADRICSGQTKNTTAKITCQHGLIYNRLIDAFGKKNAAVYAKANMKAIEEFRSITETENINCSFETLPSYLYGISGIIEKEYEAAKSLGIEAELVTEIPLDIKVKRALRFDNQAQFNPLAFAAAISKKLKIFEKSTVVRSADGEFTANGKKIKAKNIVVASHFPFIDSYGWYFMRMHQARSYVAAFENCGNIGGIYYGTDPGTLSFRNYNGLLLASGGSHHTGESKGDEFQLINSKVKTVFPKARETARWSAQDCMPPDSVPYIGRYSAKKSNVYVATGFQKWGMTSSMVAAEIIADMICGKDGCEIFSPQRGMGAAVGQLMSNGIHSVDGLLVKKLKAPSKTVSQIKNGEGAIVRKKGKAVAAYRDDEGKVHTVCPNCSHMGCRLSFNSELKSWDCPCHGSRFDVDGKVLDNPALKDLEKY